MASHLTVKPKVPNRSNALPSACLCPGCIANTWPQARDSTVVGSPTSKPILLSNHVSGQEKDHSQYGPSSLSDRSAAACFLLQPQRASLFLTRGQAPLTSGSLPPSGAYLSVPFSVRPSWLLCVNTVALPLLSQDAPSPFFTVPHSVYHHLTYKVFLFIIPLPQLKCYLLKGKEFAVFYQGCVPSNSNTWHILGTQKILNKWINDYISRHLDFLVVGLQMTYFLSQLFNMWTCTIFIVRKNLSK